MPKSLMIIIMIFSILVFCGGAFFLFSNLINTSPSSSPEVIKIQSSLEKSVDLLSYVSDTKNIEIRVNSNDYTIDNFQLRFAQSGTYEVNIIKNKKIVRTLNISIIDKIDSISFDFSDCELFYNKTPNSKRFKILDDSKEISLNYVGLLLVYDKNVIDIQNDEIVALKKGNTTLTVECEGFSATANITVDEWNYAQSINFEEQTILLKNVENAYVLSPNVSYINSNEAREKVDYSILSGEDFCELNDNILTPISAGQVVIKASIRNEENSYLNVNQIINIEPLMDLNISIIDDQNNQTLNVKSGAKANASYENYRLKIVSNIGFNEELIYKIISFIYDNYNEEIDLFDNYFLEDSLIIEVSFKSAGILNLKLSAADSARNYSGNSVSNELEINQTPFVQNINLSPKLYTDKNSQEYSIESELQENIEVFTLYNAKGNDEELLCAIGDRKPYFVEFEPNVECNFELIGNSSHVVMEGNKIISGSSGLQNILVSALDGSGVTKLISINVVDIEVENYDFSDILTTYTFFIDENPILNCTPKYIPCYATIKPEFSIELNDYNPNGPCAIVEGNNIIASKPTTSDIMARIILEQQVMHTITFSIYQERPVISVSDGNMSVNIISQSVNQACIYNVLVDGGTPENVDISYKFLSNDENYENSYPNLDFSCSNTTSFILNGRTALSTKLKITINQFEFVIDVVIS